MKTNLRRKTVYAKRKTVRTLKPNRSLFTKYIPNRIWQLRSNRARDAWEIRKLKAFAKAHGVIL